MDNEEQISEDELYLIQKITEAINQTTNQQKGLLVHGPSERNFSTYLANNIRDSIKLEGIVVDAPYIRHLGASKMLSGRRIELDLAVHTRDTDANNLVAIELETANKPIGDDVWKIEGLTTKVDGYGYHLGLYLVIGVKKKAGEILVLDWYKNGQVVAVS